MNTTLRRTVAHWLRNGWCESNQCYTPTFGLCYLTGIGGNAAGEEGDGTVDARLTWVEILVTTAKTYLPSWIHGTAASRSGANPHILTEYVTS